MASPPRRNKTLPEKAADPNDINSQVARKNFVQIHYSLLILADQLDDYRLQQQRRDGGPHPSASTSSS